MNLSLEEQKLNDDDLYEFDKVKILIHEKDMVYFNNTKLDYITDPLGASRFQLIKI